MSKALIQYQKKLDSLIQTLASFGHVAIAFSGGLDSRFLSFVAMTNKIPVLLVHAGGPHIRKQDSKYAQSWATKHGISIINVSVNPLECEEVVNSGKKRCYYCKKHLFGQIEDAVKIQGRVDNCEYTICDGTNADDYEKFRPGLLALKECGVRSPLAESLITKRSIRELGLTLGFDDCQQASRPCLLTRFPYHIQPACWQLEALGRVEDAIERITATNQWFLGNPLDFRLRYLADENMPNKQKCCNATEFSTKPASFKASLFLSHAIPQSVLSTIINFARQNNIYIMRVQTVQDVSGYYDRDMNPEAVGLESIKFFDGSGA